jgi:hypothetical protein
MYVGKDWDIIEPSETDTFSLEFTSRLKTGETVASTSWQLAVVSSDPGITPDASAASRLVGAATATTQSDPILGTRTFSNQTIGNGVIAGNTYRGEATIVTSLGRTLTLWSHVYCQAPG